jgi:hypothetical protein
MSEKGSVFGSGRKKIDMAPSTARPGSYLHAKHRMPKVLKAKISFGMEQCILSFA